MLRIQTGEKVVSQPDFENTHTDKIRRTDGNEKLFDVDCGLGGSFKVEDAILFSVPMCLLWNS